MDEKQQASTPEEESSGLQEQSSQQQERYVPRPPWQVWGARIGLVLFILMLIMYYINMFRGGR